MKKIVNYIILIFLLGLTAWILISNNDFSEFPILIEKTNKSFILLAFLCMILFWICDAFIIHKMKKILNIKGGFGSSFKLAMIGQYYGAITPFATGGQPAQVYLLANDGVQVGTASSLLITKFLIYQLVVTFYSAFMFILKFRLISGEAKLAIPFIITGCFLNFSALLIIMGFFFNERLFKKIFTKIFNLGYKIKLVKDIKNQEDKLDKYLMDFKESIDRMREDKKNTFMLILATFIQLTFYFSITYFVYLAVGLRGEPYSNIIGIQSLLYMAVSFMPTPGTIGVAEGGFYILYSSIFPDNTLTFTMLLWRFIDYYFGIIVGGLFTLFDFIIRKSKISHSKA
ncbi:lysylphosphatidylglycerol synthase transmembrane domain-containing protein [Tissierella praeacuta]|uniref:lysylphosphatidylglycerol synthase transmembrane domain-containing protein n=1 Tax=Tissierella praeacuta TaxID=43131 RepID=UPI00333E47F6